MLKNLMTKKHYQFGAAMELEFCGSIVRSGAEPGGRMPALHGRRDARRYDHAASCRLPWPGIAGEKRRRGRPFRRRSEVWRDKSRLRWELRREGSRWWQSFRPNGLCTA